MKAWISDCQRRIQDILEKWEAGADKLILLGGLIRLRTISIFTLYGKVSVEEDPIHSALFTFYHYFHGYLPITSFSNDWRLFAVV